MISGPRTIRPGPRRRAPWALACALLLSAPAAVGCACHGPAPLPGRPLLDIRPLQIAFRATAADPGPDSQSVEILELRGYPLTADPVVDVRFQDASRGWLRKRVTGKGRVFSVVLDTNTDERGLMPPPGTYTAALLIDAKGADGVPATVTVTLTVE